MGYRMHSGDPHWIVAKYPGKDRLGREVKVGDRVFYYPRTRTMLVGEEAERAARDFNAHAFDEAVFNNSYQ